MAASVFEGERAADDRGGHRTGYEDLASARKGSDPGGHMDGKAMLASPL